MVNSRSTDDHDRKWTNWESALADLASEEWIIDGPHGKQRTIKPDADRHICGYALKWTIHLWFWREESDRGVPMSEWFRLRVSGSHKWPGNCRR